MWVHVRSLIMAVDMAVGMVLAVDMVMVMVMDAIVINTNVN